MAQEKARTTRARKKTDEPAAEKPKPATRRTRKSKAPADPGPDAIAELAYFMWERGEPGGETEHWLRAESELRVA